MTRAGDSNIPARLLILGAPAESARLRALAGGLGEVLVAPGITAARAMILGRPPRAILVAATRPVAPSLEIVQALASGGEAPVLVIGPALAEADQLVALQLGAAECVTDDPLTAERLAAAVERADARNRYLARFASRAALFEALIQRDADGLLALDGNLRITYASAGVERLLGYPAEETVGRSLLEYLPPEATDATLSLISEALSRPGDHLHGDSLVRHADGSDRRIEGNVVNLLGDPPIHALIFSFRDGTERQRAQNELRENEQRFRVLAERAPVMIWFDDPERRLLWENQTALEFVGRSLHDEAGYGWLEAVHPDDRQRVEAHYQASRTAPAGHTLEFRMRRHDGVYREVLQIAIPQWTPDGVLVGFMGVDVDVSEFKEREARLEAAEARYRQIADTVPVMVWMDDAQHRLTYQNQTAEEFSGRTLAEEEGEAWYEGIHPEDRPAVLASYARTSRHPVPYQHMYRLRRNDGAYRWFIEIGVPRYSPEGEFTGFTGVDVDIHDLKEASARLADAESRYRHFIEQSTEGIWRMELGTPVPIDLPPEEQIRRWYEVGYFAEGNLAMAQMYGFDRVEELLDCRLGDLLPLDDPANQEYLRAFITSGYKLVQTESHEIDRTGRRKYFLNNLVGVVENGMLIRSWGTQRDVTQQRILEEEARQARKMETAGRLAGGIAHDFNNLLTAILGTAEILLNELPPGSAERSDIEEIKRAATRAANLTRQLLAFSRRQVLQPRVVELDGLVRGVETMLRRLIGEHIDLLVDSPPGLWRVRADPGQLEQVIVNLCVNARDAMPTGGRLRISTARCDFAGVSHGEESIMPPGSYVLLTVGDTGTGMDAETLRHLFEPFFTTKAPGKGTGLGLATVYGIVKQSGGFIFATSEVGQGSEFRIYLPAIEDVPDPAEPVTPGGPTRKATGTILLVEDEEAVRRLARRVLEGVGYRVLEAGNGADALTLADRLVEQLDLVVTDVVMPGMSGQELSTRLRQRTPDLKILYVSGYTDDAILRLGNLLPNTAFLQKPFTPGALADRVREVLGH